MTINNQILKDAVGFQKTLFDDAFDLLVKFQNDTENLTTSLIERYGNVPGEWKKNIGQWSKTVKDGRQRVKSLVDDGFKKIGDNL